MHDVLNELIHLMTFLIKFLHCLVSFLYDSLHGILFPAQPSLTWISTNGENENSQRHNHWEVKQTSISFPRAELEDSTASKEKITNLFCFIIDLFFFNNFQQPRYVHKILFHSSTSPSFNSYNHSVPYLL